ncbi:MAG: hypothetical protein ACKOB4_12965, partial [Acidobacteriota bacterium]
MMRLVRHAILVGVVLTLLALGKSRAEAQALAERAFEVASTAEVLLDLTASSPGAAWITPGREAAALRILLDGRATQDLLLYGGATPFTYHLSLGQVAAGRHTLRIDFNRPQSAASLDQAKVDGISLRIVDQSQPEFNPLSHAPVLYARPDTIGKFSDLPLLMYYETERQGDLTIYRYTVIFSNEDGGTQTSGLMARWGRTTDIEWVSEVHLDPRGRVVREIYQGVNHETKDFQGRRQGNHPELLIASVNNNFSDQGTSGLRFALAPLPADLTKASREEVMDRHRWIYRVMAEEMIREEKITTARTLGESIIDLRHYLYLDVKSTQRNGAVISFAVKLRNGSRWYTSNLGINSYKVERSGYFRTTIPLPAGARPSDIERLAARCDVGANPRTRDEVLKATTAACD